MTGRPRTRYAKALAAGMVYELEHGGPATIPELLERIGYSNRDALARRQTAALNMAVRELLNGPIAVDPWTGRLHHHRRGTPAPWRARRAA